jgi:phytoene/squalene synthetase
VSEPALSPCAEIVRRGDPDRFLSALTAPPALRERLFALYAFNIEIARATQVSEPMLGLIRLQWWRETLEAVHAGGAPRAGDVAAGVAAAIRDAGLPPEPFALMIDARCREIECEAWGDGATLRVYLADTGGALTGLAAHAVAGPTPCAEAAGFAFAAAAWLRAAPALIAQGARPLPDGAGALASEALARLAEARAARPPAAAAAALRAGWRAEAALRQAAQPGYDAALGPAFESEFRRRGRLLWLALRGGW